MIMMNQYHADLLEEPQLDALEEQSERDRPPAHVNVGNTERIGSAVAGAGLAAFGLWRRSLPGLLLAGVGGVLMYRGIGGHCPAYEALDIDTAADQAAGPREYFERGIQVRQAYTINRSPAELYSFWRDFTNLPHFMRHLESVETLDYTHSRWIAKAPSIAGGKVQWDAEIINDQPNALIAWRSVGNPDVEHAGSVRFVPAPGSRGTEVHVSLDYIPPAGGKLGSWLAMLFGEEPRMQIEEDLRRFKRLMETGEIPTTKGQPKGNCRGTR